MSEEAMVDLGAAEAPNPAAADAVATPTAAAAAAGDAASAGAAAASPRTIEVEGQQFEVPEQYWDAKANAPNIGALVKANQDMRTKLAARAPEAYDLTVPEEYKAALNLDPKDTLVAEGLGILKEGNVDQATASKLLAWMGKREAAMAQADAEAEAAAAAAKTKLVETLGGEAQVADLNKWLTAVAGGQPVRTTIEGALALAKWRASLGEKGVPSARDVPGAAAPLSQEQLRAIMAEPDYWSNPAKQKQVAEGYERLFPSGGADSLKPGVL
ncbi:hypothetical protein [Magnetospirillum sp. UT-4]|uniref:hypothetical protein n=1 Tax=Magnetospirillum sp. UT-4 TaxID=2681467 RepID=UPI001385FEA9|nr:hypothetical protein [Magnetospirillum sp. UT-4]CAA7621170.1 hypothetical protein MTBUT4_380031 [Magnetospirillum sp. UT-4]